MSEEDYTGLNYIQTLFIRSINVMSHDSWTWPNNLEFYKKIHNIIIWMVIIN